MEQIKMPKIRKEHKVKKHPKLRTFFKILTIVIAFAIVVGVGIVSLMVFGAINVTKDIIDNGHIDLNYTTIIYAQDANGKQQQFETLQSEENRVWVDLTNIPDYLQKGVISIEDQRFYKHGGFDFLSTSKAAVFYLLHIPSKGGSTLTQQLVKNITGNTQKTPARKVMEIIQSLALERQLTKDQILELYLNTIYLGRGCNGVQTAASVYFGKDVKDLDLAECALIAGITQYPSQYDPYNNLQASTDKRNLVLDAMLAQGYITQEQHDEAVKEPVTLAKTKDTANINSYFGDQVYSDVLNDLQLRDGYTLDQATNLLYTGGLQIYSTVDPSIQKTMEDIFSNSKNFPTNKSKALQPQSAMVVLDPYTGQVKGIVGGRGTKTANRVLDRATQSLRQPGSSIKPIAVYGPAIDLGLIKPNDVFVDKPVTYGSWSPGNSYAGFKGAMTVRHALEQSVNTVAAQIMNILKPYNAFNYLKNKFGITTLVDDDNNMSSMALGGLTKGVSPLEMAAAYSAYANNGTYTQPITYTKVLDNQGKVILENKPVTNTAVKLSTAKTMNSMLHSVVTNGIASAANFRSDLDICGKTGTTNDAKDRWFVGYTPYYAGACWFGYDQPEAMNWIGSSNPALTAWKLVMQQINQGLPGKRFDTSGVQAYNGEPATSPDPNAVPTDENGNPIVTGLPDVSPAPTENGGATINNPTKTPPTINIDTPKPLPSPTAKPKATPAPTLPPETEGGSTVE